MARLTVIEGGKLEPSYQDAVPGQNIRSWENKEMLRSSLEWSFELLDSSAARNN